MEPTQDHICHLTQGHPHIGPGTVSLLRDVAISVALAVHFDRVHLSTGQGGRHQHDAGDQRSGAHLRQQIRIQTGRGQHPPQRSHHVSLSQKIRADPTSSAWLACPAIPLQIQEGDVYVNSQKLDEPYVSDEYRRSRFHASRRRFLRTTISYSAITAILRATAALGDLSAATGSTGKAVLVYWPFEKIRPSFC